MSISRDLPNSNLGRLAALKAAKLKKDNPGALGNVLSGWSTTHLDAMTPSYILAMEAVNSKTALSIGKNRAKNVAMAEARMYISHFLQVFNLGVDRGVFTDEQRSYFHLDVSSGALPPLITEAQVRNVGEQLTLGDAARVAAGGAAMAMPTAAQVTAKVTAYVALLTQASTAKDDLDSAQEQVDALNTEADNIIKRMWNEIEAAYSLEEAGSMRDNAREWGVVYVTVGNAKAVTIKVVLANGVGKENATVKLGNTNKTTDANGNAVFNTTIEGGIIIEVSGDDIQTKEQPETLAPDVAQSISITVEPV